MREMRNLGAIAAWTAAFAATIPEPREYWSTPSTKRKRAKTKAERERTKMQKAQKLARKRSRK